MKIISKSVLAISVWLLISGCVNNPADNNRLPSDLSYSPNPVLSGQQEIVPLAYGKEVPDFTLPDIYGKYYTLEDFRLSNILVIVFISNQCPFSQAYEPLLVEFVKDYSYKSVATVAILPTSPFSLTPEDGAYSDLGDTYQEMKLRARERQFNFPYLYDGDKQQLARKLGSQGIPQVFVFDERRKLRYSGRLNVSGTKNEVNTLMLRTVIDALLNGSTAFEKETDAEGCEVKWSWERLSEKSDKAWEKRPIRVSWINAQELETLLTRKDSQLRLVNFWASWCKPCKTEMPRLIELERTYGSRSFNVQTISFDDPDGHDQVVEFLNSFHTALENYHFSEEDKYELIRKIDPQWGGELPYSMLIGPEGKVLYRTKGIVNVRNLRRLIVDHPLMGRE